MSPDYSHLPSAPFLPLDAAPHAPAPIHQAPAPQPLPPTASTTPHAILDPEWATEPPLEYLPDGTPLRLTFSRKEIYLTVYPEAALYPDTLPQATLLLFLCAHPRTTWTAPVLDPDLGLLAPLHTRPDAFHDYLSGWKDRALRTLQPAAALLLARRLWVGQHSSQVIVPTEPSNSKKKTLAPSIPTTKSATS